MTIWRVEPGQKRGQRHHHAHNQLEHGGQPLACGHGNMEFRHDDRQRRAQLQLGKVADKGDEGQDCDRNKRGMTQLAVNVRFLLAQHSLQFATTVLDSALSSHAHTPLPLLGLMALGGVGWHVGSSCGVICRATIDGFGDRLFMCLAGQPLKSTPIRYTWGCPVGSEYVQKRGANPLFARDRGIIGGWSLHRYASWLRHFGNWYEQA